MQLSVRLQLLLYVKLNFVAFKAEKREQMTITAEVQEIWIFDCQARRAAMGVMTLLKIIFINS